MKELQRQIAERRVKEAIAAGKHFADPAAIGEIVHYSGLPRAEVAEIMKRIAKQDRR